jgi:ferrochelatase
MPTGVILATYGEPMVNSFAEQWIYSYRILKGLTRKIAKIPAPLLPVIATARARGRVRLWRTHSFVSPLEHLHRDTVQAVRDELALRGLADSAVVVPAYEFRRPNLTGALRTLHRAGCRQAIVVPMYIAEGDFTHGMTQFAVDDAVRALPAWRGNVKLASMTGTNPGARSLGETLAAWLFDALKARGIRRPAPDWAVLLAAHGTVVNPPKGVDNGLEHFSQVLGFVEGEIAPHVGRVSVGWLNHARGGEWTKPAVADALKGLRAAGFKKLVYFPWGFTTDNAETILEGRIALQDMADPFEQVEYLECMNTYPGFVGLLADCIERSLGVARPQAAAPNREQLHPPACCNGLLPHADAARITA